MAFIEQPTDDALSERERELFEADVAAVGYVQNFTRAFASRPDVYDAWLELRRAIAGNMDTRRYELVTVAAASRLRSSYCTLAHGKILAERFLDADTVLGVVGGEDALPGLDDRDRVIVDLARKVAHDAASVTQSDIDLLRDVGLTDAEIFEVVLAAAARCFFTKTLDAIGVPPDSQFRELSDDLREGLTVGRPIA